MGAAAGGGGHLSIFQLNSIRARVLFYCVSTGRLEESQKLGGSCGWALSGERRYL